MRIVNTDITMQSEHRASRSARVVNTRLEALVVPRSPMAGTLSPLSEPVTLSEEGKKLAEQARQQIQDHNKASANKVSAETEEAALSPGMAILRSILETVFGVKVKLFNPRDLDPKTGQPTPDAAAGQANPPAAPVADLPNQEPTIEQLIQTQSTGASALRYTTTRYSEEESLDWQASGVVQTADGQTLSFELSLGLSRSAQWEETQVKRIGPPPKDPLVINFAGTAAQLGAGRRTLDLDQDGENETFSMLASGSGFLALDKDGDGKVSDGGELFGTQSGNGFADLAQYDEDGNGWIDEGDKAFAQLKIWAQGEHGQDQLLSLTEAGVGALFLGSQSTEFSLKDNQQQLQGQVRQTGVFLRENGTAGTLQQIDLAV